MATSSARRARPTAPAARRRVPRREPDEGEAGEDHDDPIVGLVHHGGQRTLHRMAGTALLGLDRDVGSLATQTRVDGNGFSSVGGFAGEIGGIDGAWRAR